MKRTMGQIIKSLRKNSGLTQEELAEQLNISAPAVSKWESNTAMPDISQVVPLADIFGVTTDYLFGLSDTTVEEEAFRIVQDAQRLYLREHPETYLLAYEKISEGLKKYPNNLLLLVNCMEYGLALSLPENGDIFCAEKAKAIADETIRQAKLVISYSKSTADIMRAHQVLVILYAATNNFEKAISEAEAFPWRTDYTFCNCMAYINRYMKNHQNEIMYLRMNIDLTLQTLEDNASLLGQAYYNSGMYDDAIRIYTDYFMGIKAIFGEMYPPYHDFDSENIHILLAEAYLAKGDTQKARCSIEDALCYYLNIMENHDEYIRKFKGMVSSPFIKEKEQNPYLDMQMVKNRVNSILSNDRIKNLLDSERTQQLIVAIRAYR